MKEKAIIGKTEQFIINFISFHEQPDPLTLTLESVVGDAESDVLRDLEVTESEVWPT